jgi:heme oxygenase (biliverdin-producing, ferredoxin)
MVRDLNANYLVPLRDEYPHERLGVSRRCAQGELRHLPSGRASRRGYALLLRNLLPAYHQLEQGLERHRRAPAVGAIAQPVLYRTSALEADLAGLCGPAWQQTLPLLPAGQSYAERIARVAEGDETRLIAHAYTRYLGDLSGGRILRRKLAESLGLGNTTLRFYEFSAIPDPGRYKIAYRAALDRAANEISDLAGVIDEAGIAFWCNIEVSESVLSAVHSAD